MSVYLWELLLPGVEPKWRACTCFSQVEKQFAVCMGTKDQVTGKSPVCVNLCFRKQQRKIPVAGLLRVWRAETH